MFGRVMIRLVDAGLEGVRLLAVATAAAVWTVNVGILLGVSGHV
jgi:hypothetical protein